METIFCFSSLLVNNRNLEKQKNPSENKTSDIPQYNIILCFNKVLCDEMSISVFSFVSMAR